MIRVTIGECEYSIYKNKEFVFDDWHGFKNFIENSAVPHSIKNSIVKIEKRVKDLTLEECHKLFGELKLYKLGELNYFKDNKWHFIGLDDWIDVTELFKEGAKRYEKN